MKKFWLAIGVFLLLVACSNQVGDEQEELLDEVKYLGLQAGLEAEKFAEDILLKDYEAQNCLTISNDFRTIYYGVYNNEAEINQIYSVVYEDQWSEPILFDPFDDKGISLDAPFFSPDGKRLYFLARHPVHESDEYHETLYYIGKEGYPVKLDIFDDYGLHMQFSVAENYSIYFKSKHEAGYGESDIWYSPYVNEAYQKPIHLGKAINTEANEMTPYIAPDESYIIFSRNKHNDGYGGADLYVSRKDEMGQWQEAVNIGDQVNTYSHETCPIVSPDGKYLFFNSSQSSRFIIYWLALESLDKL